MILRIIVIILSAALGGFGAELAGMLAISMPTEALGWSWIVGGLIWSACILTAVATAFYRAGRADGLADAPFNNGRP